MKKLTDNRACCVPTGARGRLKMGLLKDLFGNYVGEVDFSGNVRNLYGNHIGRVDPSGTVFDFYESRRESPLF